jgi:glycosyltransferase involved in cell wall biosynthesis
LKRVLIVAYYFPPAGGIGSQRASGFARHLPAFGWEPVVLAPAEPSYHRDPEPDDLAAHVVRTGSFEFSRAGKRVLRVGGDGTAPAPVQGVRGALQQGARRLLYQPDAQIGWYPPAVWAGRRALHDRRVDAIISTSFPITAHLVARHLHRATRVPWIAEFRDPWSLRLPADSAQRRRATALERRLVHEAARAVTVSPSWARLFSEHWGRPVDVLPNGHDLEQGWSPAAVSSGNMSVAGYLGTYYPDTQDLTGIWAALAHLEIKFRVHAIGVPDPAFRRQLEAVGLGDRLEVTGFVGPRGVRDELSRCSILLLAGPTKSDPLSDGVVAGKVWEYLATGLPIIYVGDTTCDVARVLEGQDGCALHAPVDVAGITQSLGRLNGHLFKRDSGSMSRRVRTGQLAQLLDAAVS